MRKLIYTIILRIEECSHFWTLIVFPGLTGTDSPFALIVALLAAPIVMVAFVLFPVTRYSVFHLLPVSLDKHRHCLLAHLTIHD